MRFSSIFQFPGTQRAATAPAASARMEEVVVPAPVAPAATTDLPEALDERVRLVGEWQLGDA